MAENNDPTRLDAVIVRIVDAMNPEAIWLLGSRAGGKARPESDHDLLVIMPDGTPEIDLDPVKAWSVVRGLGVPVDLVPCTRSEFEDEKDEIDTLPRAALARGRLVYEQTA